MVGNPYDIGHFYSYFTFKPLDHLFRTEKNGIIGLCKKWVRILLAEKLKKINYMTVNRENNTQNFQCVNTMIILSIMKKVSSQNAIKIFSFFFFLIISKKKFFLCSLDNVIIKIFSHILIFLIYWSVWT